MIAGEIEQAVGQRRWRLIMYKWRVHPRERGRGQHSRVRLRWMGERSWTFSRGRAGKIGRLSSTKRNTTSLRRGRAAANAFRCRRGMFSYAASSLILLWRIYSGQLKLEALWGPPQLIHVGGLFFFGTEFSLTMPITPAVKTSSTALTLGTNVTEAITGEAEGCSRYVGKNRMSNHKQIYIFWESLVFKCNQNGQGGDQIVAHIDICLGRRSRFLWSSAQSLYGQHNSFAVEATQDFAVSEIKWDMPLEWCPFL